MEKGNKTSLVALLSQIVSTPVRGVEGEGFIVPNRAGFLAHQSL
jgi:hypothetical protein